MNNSLIYQDSPFLPIVYNNDILEIIKNIKTQKIPTLSAIAMQSANIGIGLNNLHEQEREWIKLNFECSDVDISLFFFGFSSPSQLILSGLQMNVSSAQSVIGNLTKKTDNLTRSNYGIYLVNLIHDAHYITSKTQNQKPETAIDPIINLCFNKPFSKNKFYLAGIESCSITLDKLVTGFKTLS